MSDSVHGLYAYVNPPKRGYPASDMRAGRVRMVQAT